MVNVTEDDSDSSFAEAEKQILKERLEPETHDGARAISKRWPTRFVGVFIFPIVTC